MRAVKYAVFDIETDGLGEVAEGDLPQADIFCAAFLTADAPFPLFHFSFIADRFSRQDAQAFVEQLCALADSGYTLLSWNGLSFDFPVLASASGMHEVCAKLALRHVDIMFHVVCVRGHYLGLDKAARGMGLAGKPEGLSGALVPELWLNGERGRVLDYLSQDVRALMALARAIEDRGGLRWISNSGRENFIEMERLLTVEEALALPLPDTSWMTDPPDRKKLAAWATGAVNRNS